MDVLPHAALANRLMEAVGATVLDRIDIAPCEARFGKIPTRYRRGPTGAWLRGFLGENGRPFLHQGQALEAVDDGHNVVVSTPTASGKSLVFMTPAIAHLIESDCTVLAFYPLKALASDQRRGWERELERAGLPRELVGEISGDIPMADRERVIERARLILATPDVINAWMMPMTSAPAVRRFLARLALVIIDEAHSLEGVFGSQFSLLFRRLRAAHRRARR